MLKSKLLISMMLGVATLLIFNQWQITLLHAMMDMDKAQSMTNQVASQQNITSSASSAESNALLAVAKQILPTGIPPVYGAELGISFDDAAGAIPILSRFEQDSRPNKLTAEKLQRYIDVGSATSCEFCCSAKTMVFADGSKACSCAHSAAMRGVAAYLIDNYGDQLTNNQILAEVNRWKAAYFPGPTVQKFAASNGITNSPPQNLRQQVGGC